MDGINIEELDSNHEDAVANSAHLGEYFDLIIITKVDLDTADVDSILSNLNGRVVDFNECYWRILFIGQSLVGEMPCLSFNISKTKYKRCFNIINDRTTTKRVTFLNQCQKLIHLHNIIGNLHTTNLKVNLHGYYALTIDNSKNTTLLPSPPVTLRVISMGDGMVNVMRELYAIEASNILILLE